MDLGPNLIVIGAMKAGTTSLHYYLNLHPDIAMSREKELNFFNLDANWQKGPDWYGAQFDRRAAIRGESSVLYTDLPSSQGVAERMHLLVPNAKLIYVLRHPIERLISHYLHEVVAGREHRCIAEALADRNTSPYVCRSMYTMQLNEFLKWYPPSQILLLTQEELYQRRVATLQTVFRFLGVAESFHSRRFFGLRHKTEDKRLKNRMGQVLSRAILSVGLRRVFPNLEWHLEHVVCWPFSSKVARPQLDQELVRELTAHFREDLLQLQAVVGKSFADWQL